MKFGGDGRPKKHLPHEQKTHARCFLDIKRREPNVTQDMYARNYGISDRTLRRYIQRYFALEALEMREAEIRQKMEVLKKTIAPDLQQDEKKNEGSGLTVFWT